jgi:hypothetical protein
LWALLPLHYCNLVYSQRMPAYPFHNVNEGPRKGHFGEVF